MDIFCFILLIMIPLDSKPSNPPFYFRDEPICILINKHRIISTVCTMGPHLEYALWVYS